MRVEERFLNYVKINTQSAAGRTHIPSTECQWDLARLLTAELKELGVEDAHTDEHCYVMGSIPSNLPAGQCTRALGLIAHMDTATETSGENVNPQIIKNYDGGTIVLNEALGMTLAPAVFESLLTHIGEDLIVTDGTTLLGSDNKSGVAEIMAVVEYLHLHPDVRHAKLCIGFTPDEEVGNGATAFDVKAFGADLAYTVDGGELGELEYENFNGASAEVEILGNVIHPGYAKNKMHNAILIASEFQAMLPPLETPAHTEGYEGFFHLQHMEGDVARAQASWIIRDHDHSRYEARKVTMESICQTLNKKYGAGTVTLTIADRYFNMRDQILPHMELIDMARDAMKSEGIVPLIVPVRGGTDGARLSYMGLPCPNLCAGSHNTHGPYEYCSIQSMEKIVSFLIRLVVRFGEYGC